MNYDWDEPKRIANIEKHGIDFWDIDYFEWSTAETFSSPRNNEMRHIAIGYLGGRLHYVVYTERGERRRIISMRKANSREMRKYAQARDQANLH